MSKQRVYRRLWVFATALVALVAVSAAATPGTAAPRRAFSLRRFVVDTPPFDTLPPTDTLPPDSTITGGADSTANDSTADTTHVADSTSNNPSGWPDTTDLRTPPGTPPGNDAEQAALRSSATAMIKGCRYFTYLQQLDSLAGLMARFQAMDVGQPSGSGKTPFLDPMSMLFRKAGVMADRAISRAEHVALAYQLEQVCNVVVEADQMARQVGQLRRAARAIERPFDWLLRELNVGLTTLPGSNRLSVQADWMRLYTSAAPKTFTPMDTLFIAVDTTLREAVSFGGQTLSVLDSMTRSLKDVQQAMLLFAEPDTIDPTRWMCPDSYPDPNDASRPRYGGTPICGPAAPERQGQLAAHLELMQTQLRGLQMSAEARNLTVEAMRLMSDNEHRRLRTLKNNGSLQTF